MLLPISFEGCLLWLQCAFKKKRKCQAINLLEQQKSTPQVSFIQHTDITFIPDKKSLSYHLSKFVANNTLLNVSIFLTH